MTDKEQAAQSIQVQAEEIKDQWRKLVNAYYTTPLQWAGDEGAKRRKELKRWGNGYINKIKAFAARAEQVQVDPTPFLKGISLEVRAYTFTDNPAYRKDGTLDQDKSECNVRWDFHHGKGFGTTGTATAQLLMGTNDGVATSARARDKAFDVLRDAVEAQCAVEAPAATKQDERPGSTTPTGYEHHMNMLARSILAGDGRPVADRVGGPVVVPPDRAHVITLLELWGHGPLNDNGDKVRNYLDDHRSESFNRLVVRMAKGLKDMAQTWPSDRHPVVSWGELAEVLEQWHKEAGGRITKPKPAKEWDDLKTLALFHALRYAAGDRQANLSTNTEADKVARDAGYVSKGSGKILRSHFNTYRNEAGRTGKGVRSTEVLKRYDAVIPRLEKGSKALKLATKEGELVLSREH